MRALTAAVVQGQDLGELFDIYMAPQPSAASFVGEPRATGVARPRGLVHESGDWHRSVHVWMYTESGMLLLQKRAEGKDTFPGRWDVSVAGHVTSGDSVLATALKEVREELGIAITEVAAAAEEEEASSKGGGGGGGLESLGVVPTMAKGSSPISGDFLCNEYKNIFLFKLPFGDDVDIKAELRFEPNEEVADIRMAHFTEVKEALLAQLDGTTELDGPFIQRPRHYLNVVFGALAERCSG